MPTCIAKNKHFGAKCLWDISPVIKCSDDSIQILLNKFIVLCTKPYQATFSAVLCGQVFCFSAFYKRKFLKFSAILSMPYLGSEMLTTTKFPWPLGTGQTFTVVYYLCKGARKKEETEIKSLNLYLIKCNNQLHRVWWEPVGSIADYSCLFIHYWHFWCWLWKWIITKTIL